MNHMSVSSLGSVLSEASYNLHNRENILAHDQWLDTVLNGYRIAQSMSKCIIVLQVRSNGKN